MVEKKKTKVKKLLKSYFELCEQNSLVHLNVIFNHTINKMTVLIPKLVKL